MYSLCLLLLISTLFASTVNCGEAVFNSENCSEWNRDEYLDYNNRVYLQWKSVGENLIMQVTGKTKGWLGIGFSTSGSMKGADIVIGWVKNGKGYLQDRHGLPNDNGLPPIDSKQNYQLLSSSENETVTTFCFARKLSTCDEDDYQITNDTARVIWAMNPEDPSDTNEESAKYHGAKDRGASSQNLLRRSPPRLDMTDVKSFDIRVDKVEVPSDMDTYYWCQFFELPNLTEKHHIIGFEPVMQEGNEVYIHHIEIYECMGDNINELIEDQMNNDFSKGIPCLTRDSPSSSFHCQKEVMFWAPGTKGEYYPPDTGYPFGNDQYKFYFGSFHYNNPKKISGIIDSSGIRLLYTKNLRKYDAGLLLLGNSLHVPYMIIPPAQNTWTLVSPCSPQCLQATANNQELFVYGVQYHMHLAGRKIKLRHFRDGIELPPIAENNNYDFFNQQPQQFYDTVSVLPTDTLTVECYFNTSDRIDVTLGDLGTNDEMCMLYIYYYPRINLDNCMSHLQPSIVHKLVGVEELWPTTNTYFQDDLEIKEPESLRNVSLRKYLKQFHFNEDQIQTLQKNELKANKTISCVTNGSIFYPKDLTTTNYPSTFRPYSSYSDVCGAGKSDE